MLPFLVAIAYVAAIVALILMAESGWQAWCERLPGNGRMAEMKKPGTEAGLRVMQALLRVAGQSRHRRSPASFCVRRASCHPPSR